MILHFLNRVLFLTKTIYYYNFIVFVTYLKINFIFTSLYDFSLFKKMNDKVIKNTFNKIFYE